MNPTKRLSKRYLKDVLSSRLHKDIEILDYEKKDIDTTSTAFDVQKIDVKYGSKEGEGIVSLILKEYVGGEEPRDWSNQLEERKDLVPHATSMLEFYCDELGLENDENPVPLIFDSGEWGMLTEFLGRGTLENLFVNNGSDEKYLEELVELIATILHGEWELNYPYFMRRWEMLPEIRDSTKIRGNSRNYLRGIRDHNRSSRRTKFPAKKEKEILKQASEVIDFLEKAKSSLTGIIHSDLHLGHVIVNGKLKIIDYGGATIGPKAFDLVDPLKHPLAIDPFRHPNVEKQRELISGLIRKYLQKNRDYVLHRRGINKKHKVRLLRREEDEFFKMFYFSTLYRDMRAAAKSHFLKHNYPEKFRAKEERNPLYSRYNEWYLADFGETLRYLLDEGNSEQFGIKNPKNLEKVLKIANRYIPQTQRNPVEVAREIQQDRKEYLSKKE